MWSRELPKLILKSEPGEERPIIEVERILALFKDIDYFPQLDAHTQIQVWFGSTGHVSKVTFRPQVNPTVLWSLQVNPKYRLFTLYSWLATST